MTPIKGAVRWRMDLKPEDLNRDNNQISEQQAAHLNTMDETSFHCRNERRYRGAVGTVTGTRPGLR